MEKRSSLLKNCSYIGLFINIAAMIFIILPYIGLELLKAISVIIFIIAFGIDLGLITINLGLVNRQDATGQTIKNICRIYLFFCLIAVMLLFLFSLTYAFIEVGNFLRICAYISLFIAYYGIFGLGLVTVYLDLQNIDRTETWK
jgi:hypothetical protein